MSEILALRPFVPAKDYAMSKGFYEALGFQREFGNDELTIFRDEDFSFIVQNYFVQALAENFMVQLLVTDADRWWNRVEGARLVEEFKVQLPRPPAIQPWGLKVGFLFDPAGVLWHVAEARR
jgi:hypothetical protein